METLKFETRFNEPRQLEKITDIFEAMPRVDSWHVEPFSDITLLSVKGVNIRARDIITRLSTHGVKAVWLYEE